MAGSHRHTEPYDIVDPLRKPGVRTKRNKLLDLRRFAGTGNPAGDRWLREQELERERGEIEGAGSYCRILSGPAIFANTILVPSNRICWPPIATWSAAAFASGCVPDAESVRIEKPTPPALTAVTFDFPGSAPVIAPVAHLPTMTSTASAPEARE